MKLLLKNLKRGLIATSLLAVLLVGSAFQGSYFEISKQLDIFTTLFQELNTYYVDEIEPGELVKTGIDSMLESLDPYTNYIPESKIEDFRFQTTGEYGGIGALIRKQGEYIVISEPYLGFPADEAGLKAGDILLEVGGKSVVGFNTEQTSEVLKGEAGSEVKIKVRRDWTDETFTKTLKRGKIQVDCVPYYGMISDGIGYIKLTSFTDKASRDVKAAYKDLQEQGELNGLVLDLRGNPGGLLREAVNIVNFFVPKGTEIVSTRGKVKEWDKTYRGINEPLDTEIPLAVLVNGGSASASEIVSGTLQDLDRAVIIGDQTFGKGLVQQPRKLSYNAQLKVTIAKYYTPSGRCIQAINYAERDEEGKVKRIPDSLCTPFETANGRTVYDGGGIRPDIEVDGRDYHEVSRALISQSIVFDYANKYYFEHDSVPSPNIFALTDQEYDQFVEFVRGREFEFKTDTEKKYDQLLKTAEEEKYFEALAEELDHMKRELDEHKKNDIFKYRPEIEEALRVEIAQRYYYRTGRIEASLVEDQAPREAIRVLLDLEQYSDILTLAD